MSKIDYSIIGRRFGRLVVLEFDRLDHIGARFWCKCDCGNTKSISGHNLKTGHTTSCGCKKHERRAEDLTGKRFGRLYVTGFECMGTTGKSYWKCICDCGNKTVVERSALVCGGTRSCGCGQRDAVTTHGMTDSSLYRSWRSMKHRCTNVNHESYDRYGGRGITVCSEWETFENFRDWSLDNGYEPGLSIDRIDNDVGYYPENCRWTDTYTQNNNTSSNRYVTYNGITHTIAEWARLFNIKYGKLHYRICKGNMQDFDEYFNNNNDWVDK